MTARSASACVASAFKVSCSAPQRGYAWRGTRLLLRLSRFVGDADVAGEIINKALATRELPGRSVDLGEVSSKRSQYCLDDLVTLRIGGPHGVETGHVRRVYVGKAL